MILGSQLPLAPIFRALIVIIGAIPPLVSLLTAANRVFLRRETLLETLLILLTDFGVELISLYHFERSRAKKMLLCRRLPFMESGRCLPKGNGRKISRAGAAKGRHHPPLLIYQK